MNLKTLVRALIRFIKKILTGFEDPGNLSQNLAKKCQFLQQQLDGSDRHRAWETYEKVLTLASQCSHDELVRVIGQFDPAFGTQVTPPSFSVGKTLSGLLSTQHQTTSSLDAAWRLTQRLNDPTAIADLQQQICLKIARLGDGNSLLSKLLKLHNEWVLTSTNLAEIIKIFLERNSFESTLPWEPFFRQLQASELPKIHQVYAILDRYQTAAELAEADGDYYSAVRYLLSVSGQQSALHALDLANRLQDRSTIAQARQRVAQSCWDEGDYATALRHFQQAGNLDRVSNCHQQLGQLGLAIQFQSTTDLQWRQELRATLERIVSLHVERQEYLPAIELLKSVADAWRQKSPATDDRVLAEADRTQRLLTEVVKTARVAFEAELQSAGAAPTPAIFKRWSLLEAAAGNYLAAGLQAEKAQDYFAASLLFEKAEAFGQALSALDVADADAIDPLKKAQLLERGGDFFMAGQLYERLERIDSAIDMYERATEFTRAAELRQQQIGEAQSVFDERFRDLLIKAGRAERLAELCADRANEDDRSDEEKARLWRRVKELTLRGLVSQKWTDLVATELPSIEAIDRDKFDRQAAQWVQTASREVLAAYSDAIGLDLGTSNSVVCLYIL